MASGQNRKKTNNTQKRKTVTKKQRENIKQKENIKQSGIVQDEIILVIALVISLLLFLSNFDLSGAVGKIVSGFLFGMIGLMAYLLPFLIFFGTAFHISNLGNRSAGRKLLSAVVFVIALVSLIQLMTGSFDNDLKLYKYYLNSMDNKNGGGIIGGIFVVIFCRAFDVVATYIILIAIMVICIIIITGKAIFTYIAKKSKNSLEERKEYQKLRKNQNEETSGAVYEDGQYRRPPKTFLLDAGTGAEHAKAQPTKVTNLRDRKNKKEKSQELSELPIVNLDYLFPAKENDVSETKDDFPEMKNMAPFTAAPTINTGSQTVPTYEDELRSKFGIVETSSEIVYPEAEAEIEVEAEVVKLDHIHPTKASDKKEKINHTTDVETLDIKQKSDVKEYIFPPIDLLTASKAKSSKGGANDKYLKETAIKLQTTLESFGVRVTITNVSCGPAVTRYELQPEQGVKVSRITSLADDIKLNLAAPDIRIEAPIPGKAAVGIEVPNKENSVVTLREMLDSNEFKVHPSDIAFAVGKDIGGQTIITDIAKMPHLLIAGATGSGKSVCINTLIMSILYKSNPSDVRMIMVDPKVVELNVYNGIPHLLIPVVTDPKKASAALNWAVMEMTERYKKFADVGARDLKGYNDKVAEVAYLNDDNCQKLPQIVIIIDELADLMMVAPGEVEDSICRLAQMARAAGLHLIIATQRPSVNVITGLIKANIPSRIAFAVSSAIDSRTIIDGSGAEKLLGKGDMLFFPSGYPKPVRIQGAYISDKEVSTVVEFLKKNNNEALYSDDINDKIVNAKPGDAGMGASNANDRDDYFTEAGKFIIEKDKASIGMLQRVYKIGFNRAARIMDQLAEAGVVGPEEGTKPRKILMSAEQFEQYLEEN
ncbi:MAG TPA: DNA translocase FtsK [Mobilitalea sp.]|nr:DNA translocase FtsK [Mobilitalea sp.]